MIRLFVDGSLAPDKENHHLLERIPGTWESAILKGELLDKGWGAELGCPGLLLSDQGPLWECMVLRGAPGDTVS